MIVDQLAGRGRMTRLQRSSIIGTMIVDQLAGPGRGGSSPIADTPCG